jgi:hypothetical protein
VRDRDRPAGIWVIVVLELVNAVITLLDLLTGVHLLSGGASQIADANNAFRLFAVAWSVLVIVAAVALWLLSRRGWALMMVLVGVALAANLLIWWFDPAKTEWLRMSLNVIVAFYLNSAQVRNLFITHHDVSRIALSGRAKQ